MQRVGGKGEYSCDVLGQNHGNRIGHIDCGKKDAAESQTNFVVSKGKHVESADADAVKFAPEVGASIIKILCCMTRQQVLRALRKREAMRRRVLLAHAIIYAVLIPAEDRRKCFTRSCGKARMSGIGVQLKSHVECVRHESMLICSAPKGSPPLQQCNLPRGFASVAARLSTCAYRMECIVRLSSIVCVDCGSVEGGALIDVLYILMLCMHSLMIYIPDLMWAQVPIVSLSVTWDIKG